MQNLILLFLFISISNFTGAQVRDLKQYAREQKRNGKNARINHTIIQKEEGITNYKKQVAFGVKLNTDGYAAFYEKGRMLKPRRSRLFQIELGERKHPKEEKVVPGASGTLPRKYVYGKINNFYYAKATYALQRVIGNKGSKNGVEISAIYGGGISAGLMKPYYLRVGVSRIIHDVKYDNNDAVFLDNPQLIYGASGFSKGLGEIKITPGALVKTALRFDYGRYNRILTALEVGLNAEIYTRKMQQLLLVESEQFFLNAYVAIVFGRRK